LKILHNHKNGNYCFKLIIIISFQIKYIFDYQILKINKYRINI